MVFTITSLFANPIVAQIERPILNIVLPPKPVEEVATTTPSWMCSCMAGLWHKGIKIKGNARDIETNSTPFVGAVVKFFYKSTGTYHAALLTKFTKNGFIVYETNFRECTENHREVYWNDASLQGFHAVDTYPQIVNPIKIQ